MIRWCVLLGVALGAMLLAGCEPPAASSAAANAPPGPPPPPSAPVAAPAEQPGEPASAAAEGGAAGTEFASPSAAEPTSAAAETPPAVPVGAAIAAESPPRALPAAPGEAGPFINLSAGVAVPQLLPDGTQIGVSVDYSLRGQPRTSCRYFLVVESSAGETPVPVKLAAQGGTFQGFLPLAVRPEHQPFRARIDEVSPQGKRVRVSNSAVLATSY